MEHSPKYYIVEAAALPEIFQKVAEAKRMLETGETDKVNVAAQAVGIIMSSTGYNGQLDQQAPAATAAIRYMYGGVYLLGFGLVAVFMFFFMRFEKKILPGVQEKVAELRAAKGLTASGAVDTNADGVVDAGEVPFPPLTTTAQGMPTHADPANAAGPTRMAGDDDTE